MRIFINLCWYDSIKILLFATDIDNFYYVFADNIITLILLLLRLLLLRLSVLLMLYSLLYSV